MNDDFVTAAIRNDRYLKAVRLINRFEDEIQGELERTATEIIDENSELFVNGVEPDWNNSRSSGKIIAWARVDCRMKRIASADENADQLTLNLSLRWVDPTKWGFGDTEGALCVMSFKIKELPREQFEEMKRKTKADGWDFNFAEDPFRNAVGSGYIPVETAEELKIALKTIKDHFSEFGSTYGVHPEKITAKASDE